MRKLLVSGLALAVAALPALAAAATYHLQYTTFDDGVFPVVSVDALLTTDNGEFYGAPGNLLVTSISGTRAGVAITGLADPFSEIFVPADPYYVDDFGITFTAGGVDYNFYRNNPVFYQDFGGGIGRLVFDNAVTLTEVTTTAVPEPAVWTLLIAGFGAVGLGLRRRRIVTA